MIMILQKMAKFTKMKTRSNPTQKAVKMKYKKLNPAGIKWIECENDPTKKTVMLYEKNERGEMINTSIGLY